MGGETQRSRRRGLPHLDFIMEPHHPAMKTEVWVVYQDSTYLGGVAWHAQWRCYVFEPGGDTIFDPKCLTQIAGFCQEETDKRRTARTLEREAARGH